MARQVARGHVQRCSTVWDKSYSCRYISRTKTRFRKALSMNMQKDLKFSLSVSLNFVWLISCSCIFVYALCHELWLWHWLCNVSSSVARTIASFPLPLTPWERGYSYQCLSTLPEFRVHVIALDRIDVMYRIYIAKAYILFGSTLIYT